MDSKRKASLNGGGRASGSDGRSSKRRKVSASAVDDVKVIGTDFLRTIRAVRDKTGRPISESFERLPPKNHKIWKKYWDITQRPLSLRIIEIRLAKGTIKTVSELEGYFKRMVNNVKDSHEKNSAVWEDAERMRKAGGNFMRSHNRAYLSGDYTAVAITGEQDPNDPDTEGDGDGDSDDGQADVKDSGSEQQQADDAESDGKDADEEEIADEDDAEGDSEGEDEEETSSGQGQEEVEGEEAEAEEAEAEDGEEDGEEDEEEEEEEDEEEEEENEGEEQKPVVKKRGPGRPPKDPEAHARKKAAKAAREAARAAPINLYQSKPYRGLTFQQAQEKLVEELLRTEDENGDQFFMDFVEPPPKSLKSYYRIIERPMALKKLQNMVRGISGRAFTGVSEFKTWDEFEATASLLWLNAYQFNEDESEIFLISRELEDVCMKELVKAKKHCPEPTALKIKLKVPAGDSTAAPANKKITLHSKRRVSTAAATAQPPKDELADDKNAADSGASRAGSTPAPRLPGTSRQGSTIGLTRSPSAQPISQQGAAVATPTPTPAQPAVPPPPAEPVAPPRELVRDTIFRHPLRRGRDCSVMDRMMIRTNYIPGMPVRPDAVPPFTRVIRPDATFLQISKTVEVPAEQRDLHLTLRATGWTDRSWGVWCFFNNVMTVAYETSEDGVEMKFSLRLNYGPNRVEFQMPQAIPVAERLDDGFEQDFERYTLCVDVPKGN